MARSDIDRWNQRYRDIKSIGAQRPRDLLVSFSRRLPTVGTALDIACGLGANSGYLLSLGWKVVGIDASFDGIKAAKFSYPGLMAIQADLDQYYLPYAYFDVILNFYYYQSDLFDQYKRIIKPGGIIIIETLTQKMQVLKPELDKKFLLADGELAGRFKDWTTLQYFEGWMSNSTGEKKAVASLIARYEP
jgi:tellurite methyltransferase